MIATYMLTLMRVCSRILQSWRRIATRMCLIVLDRRWYWWIDRQSIYMQLAKFKLTLSKSILIISLTKVSGSDLHITSIIFLMRISFSCSVVRCIVWITYWWWTCYAWKSEIGIHLGLAEFLCDLSFEFYEFFFDLSVDVARFCFGSTC